jgi:hypothetical protein
MPRVATTLTKQRKSGSLQSIPFHMSTTSTALNAPPLIYLTQHHRLIWEKLEFQQLLLATVLHLKQGIGTKDLRRTGTFCYQTLLGFLHGKTKEFMKYIPSFLKDGYTAMTYKFY